MPRAVDRELLRAIRVLNELGWRVDIPSSKVLCPKHAMIQKTQPAKKL